MKKLYGIVGHPVAHSLSPAMHNAAFKAAGIQAEYKRFDIDPEDPEALANFCYEADMNGIAGFSVTMPFKQTIMAYMDHYDPVAEIVGSVNTVTVAKHQKYDSPILTGANTDVIGAMQALKERTDPKGKKALVLGAGGAARAVVYGLKTYGAEVHVYNRTLKKAETLADTFGAEPIGYRAITNQAGFDIIVNTTPVGSAGKPGASLLVADQIPAGCVVMDLLYSPLKTRLLTEAERAGAIPVTGDRMLLFQAAGQFEIWTGKKAPVAVMEKALKEALK